MKYVKATTPTARTIRVRVTVTVTVDVDAWREAYGADQTKADIRDAVRSSVGDAARTDGIIAADGIIADVDVAEASR